MAQWPENVNNRFYGMTGSAEDNRVEVKFKSGRAVYHKLNTINKKGHAVKLRLNDADKTDGKTEFERFLNWYESENGSGTVPVELTDIESKSGTKEYYIYMTTWSGQKYKEVNLNINEV